MSVVVADQPGSVWWCTRCRAIYRRESPFCPADGGEIVAAHEDPLIGTELGQYVIESLLGEGAMGRVYRAHHKHLATRTYAIKVLLGDLASTQEMRMRFLNEARSASKLSHPNVVTVYDVGRTQQGLLYLTMELVDGRSLASIIEDGPIEPARVVHLARGICDGLAHAHANGIVHRDLKPENVIVVRGPHGDEVPRIVDFGIAVSIDREDARLTATGMSMGTPGYIAPEQVSGLRVDAAADQYALGVTMFEMLTGGTLPFEGAAMEVSAAKTMRDAPLVSACVPAGVEVPPSLERMIERMLARRPNNRYESIVGVGRMLSRWSNGVETEVVAAPKRSRARVFVVFALLSLVAGAAIAYFGFVRSSDRASEAGEVVAAAGSGTVVDDSGDATDDTGTAEDTADEPGEASGSADPTTRDRPPRKKRPRRGGKDARSPRTAARPVEAPTPTPTPTPPPTTTPPPVEQPPPTPPPPAVLTGRIHRVAVSGALSETDVRRALQRVEPAIRGCTTSAPGTATVRFTVGNDRRARNVKSGGVASGTSACLSSAIGATRLEVAPDVGDAEVVVHIQYAGAS